MSTPTSDIDETSARIEDKRELVEYLEGGSKPAADWRIGTEHEKFGFLREGLRPLPYDGKASVLAMLEGLRDKFGWDPIIEGGKLIGLQRDGASVSLEPGGMHAMLMRLQTKMVEGETFPMTLNFADGGTLAVEVPILGIAARGPEG